MSAGGKNKGKKAEVSSEELKDSILGVARRHFAQFGLEGTSLKEIASEAGVAGSLINYHFGDKDGLFKACIELFASSRFQTVTRLLGEAKNIDEMRVRLELFVDEMIVSVMSDPYGFEMIEREVKLGNELVLKVFQETLLSCFKTVVRFFESTQRNGLVHPDLDPLILSGLLFSSTCDSSRKDFLGKKFFNISLEQADHRKKFTRHVVTIFMNGVMK